MKKEDLIIKIAERFEGIENSVAERVAAKVAKSHRSDEEQAAAVERLSVMDVIASYTESRVTEAQRTAIETYEKKHSLKDGKPVVIEPADELKPVVSVTEPGADAPKPETIPAWAKAMQDELKALRAEKEQGERMKALSTILSGADAKTRERVEKDYARMQFADDADFQSWAEDTKGYIADMTEAARGRGLLGGAPKVGHAGGQTANDMVKARAEAIAKEADTSSVIKGL